MNNHTPATACVAKCDNLDELKEQLKSTVETGKSCSLHIGENLQNECRIFVDGILSNPQSGLAVEMTEGNILHFGPATRVASTMSRDVEAIFEEMFGSQR